MNKKQVFWLFTLSALLLIPVFSLAISMLPGPHVYASVDLPSDRIVRTDTEVELLPPKSDDYGNGAFTYTIYNQSQVTYRYLMEGGVIEVLQNDTWFTLKELRELQPGDWDTGNLLPGELDWSIVFSYETLYGRLPAGHYRVLNQVWPIGYFDQAFWVALEFDVTE